MSEDGADDTVTKPVRGEKFEYRIVHAIGDATGQSPVDLPPLYDSIDLEALAAVVVDRDDVSVTFEHSGCTVTVADGTITVEPQ